MDWGQEYLATRCILGYHSFLLEVVLTQQAKGGSVLEGTLPQEEKICWQDATGRWVGQAGEPRLAQHKEVARSAVDGTRAVQEEVLESQTPSEGLAEVGDGVSGGHSPGNLAHVSLSQWGVSLGSPASTRSLPRKAHDLVLAGSDLSRACPEHPVGVPEVGGASGGGAEL